MIEIIGGALIVIGIVMLLVLGARRPKRENALKIKQPPPPQPPPVPPPTWEDSFSSDLQEDDNMAESRRKWLRPFGVFGRLATYAMLFLLLYVYWPKDISHIPFASLTLSDVFGTVAAVGIGGVLIIALFEPSDDDGIKDAWGWLGVLIGALAVLAVFYFSSPR
jgi:hypothetical protein